MTNEELNTRFSQMTDSINYLAQVSTQGIRRLDQSMEQWAEASDQRMQ